MQINDNPPKIDPTPATIALLEYKSKRDRQDSSYLEMSQKKFFYYQRKPFLILIVFILFWMSQTNVDAPHRLEFFFNNNSYHLRYVL